MFKSAKLQKLLNKVELRDHKSAQFLQEIAC